MVRNHIIHPMSGKCDGHSITSLNSLHNKTTIQIKYPHPFINHSLSINSYLHIHSSSLISSFPFSFTPQLNNPLLILPLILQTIPIPPNHITYNHFQILSKLSLHSSNLPNLHLSSKTSHPLHLNLLHSQPPPSPTQFQS